MGMARYSFTVPGRELAGHREGTGEPALVLHGGPGLSDYTAALAGELAPLFETIRYQQRGLAPSTTDGPFTIESHVADALAVLGAIGVARAWAVGHSWGGHLALHLAAAAPARVIGVIAVDPLGAVPDGGEADLERNLTARLPAATAASVQALDGRLLAGEGSPEDAIEMLRLVWPYYFARPDDAPPMPPMKMSPVAYAETWESIRDHFERGTLVSGLPQFDGPTLFVHGRESPIPPARSEESAALVPGARVEVLPDCGHFPWLEQPGAVRRAVERLLTERAG